MLNHFRLLVILFLLCLPTGITTVKAQRPQPEPVWQSNILYYNPNDETVGISVTYYKEDGSLVDQPALLPSIPPGGSGSLLIGGIERGSAVITSSLPIFTLYEQVSASVPQSRPVYAGLLPEQASDRLFVPAFFFGYQDSTTQSILSTTLGIQNTGSTALSVTVIADGKSPATLQIPAKSATLVDGQKLGLPAGYKGGLHFSAASPDLLAAAITHEQNGPRAFAYEAAGKEMGGTTLTFPQLACDRSSAQQWTKLFIQSANPTTVTVDFFTNTGVSIKPRSAAAFTALPVSSSQTLEIDPCSDPGLAGRYGTLRVTSAGETIYGISYINSTSGAASMRKPAADHPEGGSYQYVLPYVVWTHLYYPAYTYLSIVNAGSTPANIDVQYLLPNGEPANNRAPSEKITRLPSNAVRVSSPQTGRALMLGPANSIFGANGFFRGSVRIVSDQPLLVNSRIDRTIRGKIYSESYSAFADQP